MRLAKWVSLSLVFLVCLIGSNYKSETSAASSKLSSSERTVQRKLSQSRIDEIKRHALNLNNLRGYYRDDAPSVRPFDRSIIADQTRMNDAYRASASATPPPPSPGIVIGRSSMDYQANDSPGYQVARTGGADIVHFVWMSAYQLDDEYGLDRFVAYTSYSISGDTLLQHFGGTYIGQGVLARAGYPAGDVWDDNSFQAVFHQAEIESGPYTPWHLAFPMPGSTLRVEQSLEGYGAGGCPEVLWPRIASSRDGNRTTHVIAHSNTNDCPTDLLWYWRYNGTD